MARLPLFVDPVEMDLAFNEPEENLRRMRKSVDDRLAAHPDIPAQERLFVFPELTLTGFVTGSPRSFSTERPDPVIDGLRALARETGTALAAGFPETREGDGGHGPAAPEARPSSSRERGKPYNVLALVGPDGRILAKYRKTHLFTFGKTPETAAYSAGEAGVLCMYRGWRVALSVCFDIRFPRLYHAYAREGADLILAASCWLGGPHKAYQYKTINSAHAILTQAYVAAVNRTGKDPSFSYEGGAHVFSPFGEDLYEGAPCRLDPQEIANCRGLAVRPSDRDSYPVRCV